MPAKFEIKTIKIPPEFLEGEESPDFVEDQKHSTPPNMESVKHSLHPSASLETFEGTDDPEDEGVTSTRKKSNKGVLVAGAAVLAVLALRK